MQQKHQWNYLDLLHLRKWHRSEQSGQSRLLNMLSACLLPSTMCLLPYSFGLAKINQCILLASRAQSGPEKLAQLPVSASPTHQVLQMSFTAYLQHPEPA